MPLFKKKSLLIALLFLPAWGAMAVEGIGPAQEAFLSENCMECHDDDLSKGGLNFYDLDANISGSSAVEIWTRVYDNIASGTMPPPKKPRPPEEGRKDFLQWLEPRLFEADRAEREVVLRRLNRTEYENTIRSLLKIDIDLKHLLPEDQKAGGFDNNGSALAISAELIERYLATARLALDEAIVHGDPPETQTFKVDSRHEVDRYLGNQYKLDGDRVVTFTTNKSNYSKISTRGKRLPQRGRYRFKFTVATHQSEEPIVFSVVASDFKRSGATFKNLGFFEAKPEPAEFEIVTVLDEGFAIQFFAHGLPTWINKAATTDSPGVGFGPVEITGPLLESWPPPSHSALLGDVDLEKGTLGDARSIIRDFLPRAFRRPCTDQEVERYLQLVSVRLESGRSFESSLRVGLEAILCSPDFLFMRESSAEGGHKGLTEHELASRIAYFLWSAPPDDQLVADIRGDRLEEGIDRMLDDPRAQQFIENFTGQWLGLNRIEETTPDSKLYSSFDELLQFSMVEEGRRFFATLIGEDLPIYNLIDSDFILANSRLAELYQIDGVRGLDLQKVSLSHDSVRGGVLTQAGVLKVTANGTNTSPVTRGVWVLENILGGHVPPPPPNIDGIEPDIREATTIREQLDAHRDSESCRECHKMIDPPGFALESFDPIGAYRENYLQFKVNPQHADKGWGSVVKAKEVDASGEMVGGRSFRDINEFKAILLEDTAPFAHALTERLLTYALGRELGFSDRPAVSRIVERTKSGGSGLRTLIKQIILSEIFSGR